METEVEDNLEPGDIENLRHMLGAEDRYPKNKWGFRNHYFAGPADEKSMGRLVSAGLARKGSPWVLWPQKAFRYHATEAGCERAGLTAQRIQEALNP